MRRKGKVAWVKLMGGRVHGKRQARVGWHKKNQRVSIMFSLEKEGDSYKQIKRACGIRF